MNEADFFQFGTTLVQTLVKTFNDVLDWASQPFVQFLADSPVEIPSSVLTYVEKYIGDTSLLLMMFGASLSVLIAVTLIKWIIGIVM